MITLNTIFYLGVVLNMVAKRTSRWTEEKIACYLKEGRDQGELSEYIPSDMIKNGTENLLHK